jgi:TonB family protein
MNKATAAAIFVMMAVTPALADQPASTCTAPVPLPIMETHVLPPYPDLSKRLSEQGQTVLQITIAADGSAQDVSLARSSGFERLDSAAVDFVKSNWRWQPLTANCKAATASTRIMVNWRLNNSPFGAFDAEAILDLMTFLPMDAADYPPDALAAKQKGAVLLGVFLSDSGTADRTVIIRGSGVASLDAKSLEIAKSRYHWTPAQMSGKPVGGLVMVIMMWVLPGDPVPTSDQIKSTLKLFLPKAPATATPPPPPAK